MCVPYSTLQGAEGSSPMESQHFTNHVGHFALTGLLRHILTATKGNGR